MKAKLLAVILAAAVGVPAAGTFAASNNDHTTTTSTTMAAVETTTSTEAVVATEADIQTACARDGIILAAKESVGVISPIEQAALDALRPICEQNGLALPAAPQEVAPAPQVVTVYEQQAADAAAAPTTGEHEGEHESEHEGQGDD
jgi:hypothetical protein